jgi:hypothetical protein
MVTASPARTTNCDPGAVAIDDSMTAYAPGAASSAAITA